MVSIWPCKATISETAGQVLDVVSVGCKVLSIQVLSGRRVMASAFSFQPRIATRCLASQLSMSPLLYLTTLDVSLRCGKPLVFLQSLSVRGSTASSVASCASVSKSAAVLVAGVVKNLVMPHDGAAWLKDIVRLEDFRGLISQCEA